MTYLVIFKKKIKTVIKAELMWNLFTCCLLVPDSTCHSICNLETVFYCSTSQDGNSCYWTSEKLMWILMLGFNVRRSHWLQILRCGPNSHLFQLANAKVNPLFSISKYWADKQVTPGRAHPTARGAPQGHFTEAVDELLNRDTRPYVKDLMSPSVASTSVVLLDQARKLRLRRRWRDTALKSPPDTL